MAKKKENDGLASTPISDKLAEKLLKKEVSNSFRAMLVKPYTYKKEVAPTYKHILAEALKQAVEHPNSRAGLMISQALLTTKLIDELDASVVTQSDELEIIEFKIFKGMFKKQSDVYGSLSDSKFHCIMTSRRAGKTALDIRLMLIYALVPKTPILFVGLTKLDAIALVWDELMDLIAQVKMPVQKSDKVKGEILFTNGSKIKIAGNASVPDQENLRGGKYKLIIIDEAQSQRSLVNLIDNILLPTMSDFADSRLLLTGTPPRVKKTYFENAFNNPKWINHHWTAADNPFMPDWEQTIKTACEMKGISIDAPLIQREYYGRICYDTEALVFANYQSLVQKIKAGSYLPENPIEPELLTDGIAYELPQGFTLSEMYGGIDWGYTDKAAAVLVGIDNARKKACLLYEIKNNKLAAWQFIVRILKMHEYAKELKALHSSCNRYFVMADTNERALTMELYSKYKMPMQNAYKIDSVIHLGILADLCRVGQLTVPSNSATSDEFDRIVYKRDEADNILHEIDDKAFHPDIVMALLYATRYWLSVVRPDEARFATSEVEK